MHLPRLIIDLALILGVSGIVSILFRWLRQPLVLGYLLAGLFVGPQFHLLPTVADPENIKVWAELGVVFLLFLLGLEFSFHSLKEVGRVALVAAAFEVVGMTALGYFIGHMLGWAPMDALFLGGILAISSTTIIIKAFDELGVKTQSFAQLVFGILIFEDVFAILLLGLLSTIAATKSLEGPALLMQVGRLLAYLAIVIPLGIWIVPRIFRLVRLFLTDEIRVILSLGLCLISVVGSTAAGFSPALGAFLMGAFISESAEGERAERFLKPIRDLFGAIFFTSIGMLVDFDSVLANGGLILLVTVITVIGKVATTALGARIARQSWKTSAQAGLCLGQIGEFSFIIATLGMTLGVTRPELYPVAVAVSMLTTFLTPYLIRWASQSPLFAVNVRDRGTSKAPKLWAGHLVEFEIHPHFKNAGATLEQLKLRETFNVSLVAILRGELKIIPPTRDDTLMPFDRVVVFGNDAQLAEVEKFLRLERHPHHGHETGRFALEKIRLESGDPILGMTLRKSGVREKIEGIVLGIERGRERLLNPDSTTVLKENDVLWVYGPSDRLKHWVEILGS